MEDKGIMATPLLIQPFRAIRPEPEYAVLVAARPYDVVTHQEAVAQAADNPRSFLHVSRAEIDCPPGSNPYSPQVYRQSQLAFDTLIDDGILLRDDEPCLYAYRMIMDGHVQTGVAAAASVEAYTQNRIRRHEHTRPAKEQDRVRQIEAVNAHTGPVLVAHPPSTAIARILETVTGGPASADAVTVDGTRHQIWPITDKAMINALVTAFEAFEAIYIADGHHRSAAAARLCKERNGDASQSRFLIVSFPSDSLNVLDYNRTVTDLNGLSVRQFMDRLEQQFTVEASSGIARPERRGTFTMFLDGQWFRLALKEQPTGNGPAREHLDVSLLNERLLEPILGIGDTRTDPRVDFVGGGRGLEELQRRVRSKDCAIAFALFPTAFEDVMAVADAGDVMPPKSTWFEPKLADGLLSLPIDA